MGQTKEETGKSYSIRITRQAFRSFDQIIGYIAIFMQEPLNAISVGEQIYKTIDRIGKNPFAFRECEEIPTPNKIHRKALCLSWLIIYRVNPDEVVILDIIHGSRQSNHIKRMKKIK